MACFTALSVKLRHHQVYNLFIFMNAKLYKNFNFKQKNVKFLIFLWIFNKKSMFMTHF